MMDYEFLRFAWWILVCVLLIGFAVTDGFDMGVLNLLQIKKELAQRKRLEKLPMKLLYTSMKM